MAAGPSDRDPLDALDDVGRRRRELDVAELDAVRAARRSGRSWAEIATRLGVSRQSAWEKWRDLDEDAPAPVRDLGRPRTRGSTKVPDVVSLSFADARDVLHGAHLVPADAAEDGAPLAPQHWSASVVVRQYPEPGIKVPRGTTVRLWLERGGGEAGVREPRRPYPRLQADAGEPTHEDVG